MKITGDLRGREARKAPTTDFAGAGSMYQNTKKNFRFGFFRWAMCFVQAMSYCRAHQLIEVCRIRRKLVKQGTAAACQRRRCHRHPRRQGHRRCHHHMEL